MEMGNEICDSKGNEIFPRKKAEKSVSIGA